MVHGPVPPQRGVPPRFVRARGVSPLADEDAESARLVRQLQLGDPDAFGRLYLRYFDRIYGYVRMALRDAHDAEDATQDVFAQAYRALPRFELRGQPVRGWLFRVARNVAIDRLRRRRTHPEAPMDLDGHGEAGAPDEADALRHDGLLDQVRLLPDAQREVVVLRYAMEFTFPEIAEVTGRTPAAVRQMHQRAISTLRTKLEPLRQAAVS